MFFLVQIFVGLVFCVLAMAAITLVILACWGIVFGIGYALLQFWKVLRAVFA